MTSLAAATAPETKSGSDDTVYLDFNATTPVAPAVLAAMLPYFAAVAANPASSHRAGAAAAKAVETARELLADSVGGSPAGIIFTSGATEADNLAFAGLWPYRGVRQRVITVATEHKAVLEAAHALAALGADLVVLPVDRDGLIDLGDLEVALLVPTLVVSVAAANNETGVVPDLAPIIARSHAAGAVVHSDAAQVIGKIAFDITDLGLDLVSLSSHKTYGPKGVGALYVRPGVEIAPLLLGGGQEHGRRSGTLNVPGIVGFGAAAQLAVQFLPEEAPRQAGLLDVLWQRLSDAIPGVRRNTPFTGILPNTLNVSLPVDADDVLTAAPGLAASTGSACNTGSPEPSYVLQAMGRTYDDARAGLRLSIGRSTTEADVAFAVAAVAEAIDRLEGQA